MNKRPVEPPDIPRNISVDSGLTLIVKFLNKILNDLIQTKHQITANRFFIISSGQS